MDHGDESTMGSQNPLKNKITNSTNHPKNIKDSWWFFRLHRRYRSFGYAKPQLKEASHGKAIGNNGPTTRSLGDLRSPWLLTTY